MNNSWLSFLIPKERVVVASMEEVSYLHRRKVMIYELKKHPEGYQITVRKGVLENLDVAYSHPKTLSIYPTLGKFALPILAVFFSMMALMQRFSIGYTITGNLNPEQVAQLEEIVAPHFHTVGPFEFLLTDTEQIGQDIKAAYDEYTKYDVFRDGNNINIQVYLSNNSPESRQPSYSYALYARRSALIKEVSVKTGRSLVAPGQLVKEGERLVTSTVLDPTGSNAEIPTNRMVEGEIWGETWYLAEVTFPLQYMQNMLTTQMETRRVLHVGGQSWQFPGAEVEFADYVTSTRRINPFFFLENSPLFLETIHYYEKSDIMKVNDVEEIKEHAAALIKNEFARQIGEEFELVDLRILETGGMENQVSLLFHVTILENVAY